MQNQEDIATQNEQIVQSVYKIMDILHDPNTGFDVLRGVLGAKCKRRAEYERAKDEVLEQMATKHGIAPDASYEEMVFALTGQDIMENHIYFTCGNAAKAFCYINEHYLSPDERLDLMIAITTQTDHLIDAMRGHTVPIVKMANGKYMAIDPQVIWTTETKQDPFIHCKIFEGAKIHRVLDTMRDKEYEVIKIVTYSELESIYSDFGRFLMDSAKREGKIKSVCEKLNSILNGIKATNSKDALYEFCVATKDEELNIKITRGKYDDGHQTYLILTEFCGNMYSFSPRHKYLMLHKWASHTETILTEPGRTYSIIWQGTPAEYIASCAQTV